MSDEVVRTYADGEVIVQEGETGREMYVIQRGKVKITKRAGDRVMPLAELGKGDFFGEMSLLEDTPRDADVTAVGETRLLVIQPGGLLVRIRRDPTFAFEMLHKLSGRLRLQNARVALLLQTDDEEEMDVMHASVEELARRIAELDAAP